MITHIMDMSSGGRRKTDHEHYMVQAPEGLALAWFQMKVYPDGPDHVTCDCCGSDFAVHEQEGEWPPDTSRDRWIQGSVRLVPSEEVEQDLGIRDQSMTSITARDAWLVMLERARAVDEGWERSGYMLALEDLRCLAVGETLPRLKD